MKIKTLFLKAFGPFTERTLEFGKTNANLHIIYGPNEAGKSSALRAIADLRFGIPQQSKDNFVHEHKNMAIAATLLDAEGNEVCLHRRKGRDNTLSCADPVTGDALSSASLPPQVASMLTAGLDRAQFEAMFGLDHERLRSGGKALVNGDGEVGASLFEASSGTANVKGLLANLKEDVKAYHSPRGASATLNAARKRYEEQKKLSKDAQTKPKSWKELERNHLRAKEGLLEAESALRVLRQDEAHLKELRVVQPLLKQHDDIVSELKELSDVPLLSTHAATDRITAEQSLHRAEEDAKIALELIEQCKHEAAKLSIEPVLLEHATAIERVAKDAEIAHRSEQNIAEIQARADSQKESLLASAKRISPNASLEQLVAALPSAADRAQISQSLERYRDQKRVLADAIEKTRKATEQLKELDGERLTLATPSILNAVEEALREAQFLGDYKRRIEEFDSEAEKLFSAFSQELSDLGMPSIDQLTQARPLLPAEIDAAEQAFKAIDAIFESLNQETATLKTHLREQENRLKDLRAMGEIATLRTLTEARDRRNDGWDRIKRTYVLQDIELGELAKDYDIHHPLPEAFELAQAEADHQADVLLANADRSATAAECDLRIQQMTERLLEIDKDKDLQEEKRSEAIDNWRNTLRTAGLPILTPTALREWLVLRKSCLSYHGQHADQIRGKSKIISEAKRNFDGLMSCLKAADREVSVNEGDLSALILKAQEWLTLIGRQTAAQDANERTRKSLNRELVQADIAYKQAQLEVGASEENLATWVTHLLLPTGSPPIAIQARIQELEALAAESREMESLKSQIEAGKSASEKLKIDTLELAALLEQPPVLHVMDFIDRLSSRLRTSLDHKRQLDELFRRQGDAERTLAVAEKEILQSRAVLEKLCQLAMVDHVDGLPEAEEKSALKVELQKQNSMLVQQLRQATISSIDELRDQLTERTAVDLDMQRERCAHEIDGLDKDIKTRREAEEIARRALEDIDDSDRAASAREAMESALAEYRSALKPWAQLRLAAALLEAALSRFKERAQAPMLMKASEYFQLATDGRYIGLFVDDDEHPRLMAKRNDGSEIGVEAMSEGTADQLYLALRLAALSLQSSGGRKMPLILDDVLMTSDDERAVSVLRTLARFADTTQVLVFTHHKHLISLAKTAISNDALCSHEL